MTPLNVGVSFTVFCAGSQDSYINWKIDENWLLVEILPYFICEEQRLRLRGERVRLGRSGVDWLVGWLIQERGGNGGCSQAFCELDLT